MASFKIRVFPDPCLRKVSHPLDRLTEKDLAFVRGLEDFMRKQPGGIGIAAPQVGVLRQIAVVDVTAKIPGTKRKILVNPRIIAAEKPKIGREGCMSLPHYTANVQRFDRILLRWHNEKFEEMESWVCGLEAICIQHEVDHLHGLLFIDRVACLENDVFRRKRYL